MASNGFQSRCLKPLGHPSAITNAYLMTLGVGTVNSRGIAADLSTVPIDLRGRRPCVMTGHPHQRERGHRP
jgi:hypothetical protein